MSEMVAEREIIDEKMWCLWTSYQQSGDIELRNQLVLEYMTIVKKIAFKLYRNSWGMDSPEELVNEGMIALINAIDRFDLERNVKFETYVSRRVQGAMMDYMYKQNGFVRRIHEMTKAINKAKKDLEIRFGREPTHEELAMEMQISREQLDKMLQEVSPVTVVSLDQMIHDTGNDEIPVEISAGVKDDPMMILDEQEYSEVLVKGINKLNEEQQLVLALFYKEEFSVREIAQTLNTTAERVSQIRFQAVKKLKKLLENTQFV